MRHHRGKPALRIAALALAAALLASSAEAQIPVGEAPADSFRVFDADLGPAWIDVNDYPDEYRQSYTLFAQRCSKCHTLARPINSTLQGEEWIQYVNRMSRKPGSGISPKDAETIQAFLLFDSERRPRQAGTVDPEIAPFLHVSRELAGVDRFPASLQDIRAENDSLRVKVEGDVRLDLSRFLENGGGQDLVRWTRRTPNQGEIILHGAVSGEEGSATESEGGADAGIAAAVEEAIGGETDPTERAELLLDWMDEEIAREYREGTATPGEVLADPRGDATEFSRLFVAMARAAGFPARERLGFVARRTAFYVTTWAEIRIDGAWTPVDPFLGQLPADLTHIRLAVPDGDVSDWRADRVPGMDRLTLRVVMPASASAPAEG